MKDIAVKNPEDVCLLSKPLPYLFPVTYALLERKKEQILFSFEEKIVDASQFFRTFKRTSGKTCSICGEEKKNLFATTVKKLASDSFSQVHLLSEEKLTVCPDCIKLHIIKKNVPGTFSPNNLDVPPQNACLIFSKESFSVDNFLIFKISKKKVQFLSSFSADVIKRFVEKEGFPYDKGLFGTAAAFLEYLDYEGPLACWFRSKFSNGFFLIRKSLYSRRVPYVKGIIEDRPAFFKLASQQESKK